MKGQYEVYKDKEYTACPICGNIGNHREDCYVLRSLKAQASGGYALLSDVRVRINEDHDKLCTNNLGHKATGYLRVLKIIDEVYNEHFR